MFNNKNLLRASYCCHHMELFSHHSIVKGTVNKYSYLKTIPLYHKLPNTELTSDFGIVSLAQVKMLPPNGKIHHENIIWLYGKYHISREIGQSLFRRVSLLLHHHTIISRCEFCGG
jgi:hypothetical protein